MDTRNLTNQIIHYCAGRSDIAACYLFGSYAAGVNRPSSDLDLAFLLDVAVPSTDYNEVRFSIIGDLGRICRLDVHPLIMNSAGELVLGQVFRKGICLYGRDAKALRTFRNSKLPLIAEFGYYVTLMQARMRQRYGVSDHG
jgi:predicted nucleotidyltransferase